MVTKYKVGDRFIKPDGCQAWITRIREEDYDGKYGYYSFEEILPNGKVRKNGALDPYFDSLRPHKPSQFNNLLEKVYGLA